MTKRKIPTAKLKTATFGRTTFYAWEIDGYGLKIVENSKEKAISYFLEAFKFEYGKEF